MKVCSCLQKLKCFCVRLQGAVCRHCYRVGKAKRRNIKISQPFDFKHLNSTPMGLDEDEIDVLREKAAVSRMVAIEDQPMQQVSPVPVSPSNLFNNSSSSSSSSSSSNNCISSSSSSSSHQAAFSSSSSSAYHQRPPKTRVGYRGLASSTHRGLTYATLTESRPSITQSFAVIDHHPTTSSLSPTSSFSATSTQASLKHQREDFYSYGLRSV